MPHYTEKPTLITFKIVVLPNSKNDFVDWQAKLNARIVAFPGFVSLEFLAPYISSNEWLVVQRLSNAETASAWRNSIECHELLEDLNIHVEKQGVQEITSEESSIREGATEVIITLVSLEREQHYRQWSAKIHQAEAKFPGFRGVYVQSPSNKSRGGHWITLLQFDTMHNLDKWLDSPERRELLDESASMITTLESHRVISPYPGWFASIAKIGVLPSVWKQTMVVLLVLFPIVMLELKFLSPWTASLDISLATFIGNAISVLLIAFPMMPIAIWLLGWWLVPQGKNRKILSILGFLAVVVLYLLEIVIFWNFFK